MIVQKFGGTSMGTPESIKGNVAPIVIKAAEARRQPVVVVSAMSGITNQLLEAAKSAVGDGKIDKALLSAVKARHLEVLNGVGTDDARVDETACAINKEIEELENFLKAVGIIGELSFKTHDAIVALGEKWSARLLSCVLSCRGYPAEYVNLESIIPASLPYESDAYWDDVEVLIRERLSRLQSGTIPVLTGFFGQTARGMLSTVGRGYSDYCASLVGAALKADEVQIWTDVDGVLSANPKIVPEAFIVRKLSFDEMAELANFGAKVLHPFSVRPAVNAGIPLRILNTFNPGCEGTLLQREMVNLNLPFKSVTSKRGITIVRITTPLMLLAHGYMSKVTAVFAKHKVSMDLISTSEVSVSMSIEDEVASNSPFIAELSAHGSVHLERKQSIISLVGTEMQQDCSLLGRVFDALVSNKIRVNMASLGNALINLSLVVNDDDCDRAVQTLHREFFGS